MARDNCSVCGAVVARVPLSAPLIVCHSCRKAARDKVSSCPTCGRTTRSGSRCAPCKILGEKRDDTRQCAECGESFSPRTSNQKYCQAECREAVRARRGFGFKTANPTERGYGVEHRRERARWKPLVDRGEAWCCLCGEPIEPGSAWHLDHTPDRTGYRGVAHALCNVRDGASRAATRANQSRPLLTKACGGCGATFTTTYPKQAYCSRECRPTRPTRTKPAPVPRNCIDCARPIKQGKRCRACAEAHTRTYARNYYRARVGIPLDAPRWDRTWRAA